VSVVYGTTANVAGAAIRKFWIGPSLSNRDVRFEFESGSFAGPYWRDKVRYFQLKELDWFMIIENVRTHHFRCSYLKSK